jgi:hypothetical protein
MDLRIINAQPEKYPPVKLLEPPPFGYIHVAAAVRPPKGRTPRPGRSEERTALLSRLKTLAGQLEDVGPVVKATVYEAVLVPPMAGYARHIAKHPARYDVVVLVETSSPDVIGDVQASEPYKLLLEAVEGATRDTHVMTARCSRYIGDVDKTRQGLFLFNYFVADDPEVAIQLWEHVAGWFVGATGLNNSTVLEPIGDSDYVFVNHGRWDFGLPQFMLRTFAKPSFRRFVVTNQLVNRTGAMPLLYRLA